METHENAERDHAWPLNLQLFADGDSAEAETSQAAAETAQEQAQTPPLDEAAVRAMLQQMLTEQQERSRRAEDRRRRSEARAQQQQQTEEAPDMAALRAQLQAETARANRLELIGDLSARGLPAEFADLIDVGDDLDDARDRIEALDKAFKTAVENAVKNRLAGRAAPAAGATQTPARKAMTREEIFAIKDAGKRQQAIRENAELFVKKG